MPNLTIDGRQIDSPDGSTVIQAAEKLGIFIPRYCYHPGLSIAGNCRICLIEVEKNPKLQIACNTTVADGMVVHTSSAKAEEGRRAVLEFLLANHPLDCPVCDQSGECDLQNFYMNFGLYDPRFREQKIKKKKAVAVGPHLNDGARILRVKPRYNPDVNRWWMCDEGRYGFGWVDNGRLTKVRCHGADATWEQAVAGITEELKRIGEDHERGTGSRLGVIASSQLTNEELFLIREIFQRALDARVTASFPMAAGYSDKFLIKADKTPNTRGAMAIALAGPTAPGAATIVADAVEGRLDAFWVFGHDRTSLVADADLQQLSRSLRLFVFSGTNENATAARSHWTLPTAAYLEKDGTFVNVHGRVQRVGCAFSPLSDSRADWNVLLEIAGRLNLGFAWRSPQEVFQALRASVAPFAGLTYERIGLQGASLTTDASIAEAVAT